MKKITFLFIFCLAIGTKSYGQCTSNTGGQWPSSVVTLANTGAVESIASNNWPNAEFSLIENVLPGSDYTVTGSPSLYITVTNTADDSVIVHGAGSVSFTAAEGVTGLTIYWHLNAACDTQASGNTQTTIQCTSCVCDATVAPSCVTEISPANGEASATVGAGGAVTFTWNSDPNAEGYELFINDFSQGTRSSGITFTGLSYGTAYTWSVVPKNCFADATDCPTWTFTTESCTATAPPAVAASAPTPANESMNVVIQAPDGGLSFNWNAPDTPGESYTLNIGTANPPTQPITNVENGDVITGLDVSTTYFWSIDVINCFGTTAGPVWSFTTDSALSITENAEETFSVFPNPTSDVLNIKGAQNIDTITVFNLLGQSVASFTKNDLSNSSINLSELSNGLYLVKISSGDKIQTLRVTKQ